MKFAVYLLLAILHLNIVGMDPADYLIIALSPVAFFSVYRMLFSGKVSVIFLGLAAIFVVGFSISNMEGFDPRFSVSLIINMALFLILLYYLIDENENFNIGFVASSSFLIINSVFFVIGYTGSSYGQLFDIFRNGRFMGTFGDPNFTGFAAAFAFIYFTDRVMSRDSTGGARLRDAAFMILGMIVLLLSESRAAWGAASVAALAYFAVMSGQRYKLALPAIFGLVGLVVTVSIGDSFGDGQFGAVSERVRSIFAQTDSAEAERFQFLYTRISAQVGLEHPLGVGPGMTVAYTGLVSADGLPIGSHNSFVQVFTELGWIAFGSMVLMLMMAVWRIRHRALQGYMVKDVSCRVIFAMMMGQVVFSMAHDMIAWRIGWLVPALAVCAAFVRDTRLGGSANDSRSQVVSSRQPALGLASDAGALR